MSIAQNGKLQIRTLVALCFLGLLLLTSGCPYYNKQKQEVGDAIIVKLDKYEAEHGSLPPDLSYLGIEVKEDGPVYYEKISSDHYLLYYGMDVGESVFYDSEKKGWSQ